MEHQPDVVIVGGGPIGLWTAIQIKILLPISEIVVLERHQVYLRSHVVCVSPISLQGAPKHPLLSQFIETLKPIERTNVLEDKLLNLALKLGIRIIHEKVTDLRETLRQFPMAQVVIGADGAHSSIREQFFEGVGYAKTLRSLALLKYEVEGEGKALNPVTEYYPLAKVLKHTVSELVGRPTTKSTGETTTPVSCQVFISGEEYFHIQEASFRSPYRVAIESEYLYPNDLWSSIQQWLNAKTVFVGERRVPNSENLVAIQLSNYKAKKVSFQDPESGCFFFLVGDAAVGVPFFRALNMGLVCGTKLAFCVVDILREQYGNTSKEGQTAPDLALLDQAKNLFFWSVHQTHKIVRGFGNVVNDYQSLVDELALGEFTLSETKNGLLDIGSSIVKLNSIPPWQLLFLSDAEKDAISVKTPSISTKMLAANNEAWVMVEDSAPKEQLHPNPKSEICLPSEPPSWFDSSSHKHKPPNSFDNLFYSRSSWIVRIVRSFTLDSEFRLTLDSDRGAKATRSSVFGDSLYYGKWKLWGVENLLLVEITLNSAFHNSLNTVNMILGNRPQPAHQELWSIVLTGTTSEGFLHGYDQAIPFRVYQFIRQ